MRRIVLATVLLAACGGDDSADTGCRYAVGVYYDGGCELRYVMGDGHSHPPYASRDEATQQCNLEAANWQSRCPEKWDAYFQCLAAEGANGTCGDCYAEGDAATFKCVP